LRGAWLADAESSLPERAAALPEAVDVAAGLPATPLGPGGLCGVHERDGLDGGAARDVDQIVDVAPGVRDQAGHGREGRAVVGEDLGQIPRIECGRRVLVETT